MKLFLGHLGATADEINRAAREVAARVVDHLPPLKVPLSESANIVGGKMSLQSSAGDSGESINASSTPTKVYRRRFPPVNGVPLLIGALLAKHPDGLTTAAITDKLRGKVPAQWRHTNTSYAVSAMGQKRWVTRWPGNVWRLGPKPIEYKPMGHHGNKTPPVVIEVPQKGAVRPTLKPAKSDDVIAAASRAIDVAKDALSVAVDALSGLAKVTADLDTLMLKTRQREAAVETARKLLAEAGI